jgi:hypothetical protein
MAIGQYRTRLLKELIVQRVSKMMTQGKNWNRSLTNQNVIRLDWLLTTVWGGGGLRQEERNLRDNARKTPRRALRQFPEDATGGTHRRLQPGVKNGQENLRVQDRLAQKMNKCLLLA